MMIQKIRLSLMFLLLAGGLTTVIAQTGNLYGSGTSESDILVRLINAQPSSAAMLRLGPARLETPGPGAVTSYHAIAADIYILRYQGKSIEFIPRTGTLYTIVAAGSRGLLILEDEAHNDPVRAQVYAYNLAFGSSGAGAEYSLRTADGKLELFRALGPGKSAQQAVNAISVQLVVSETSGKAVSTPFEVNLRRGSSTTIVLLTGSDGMVEVFSVLADIAGQ